MGAEQPLPFQDVDCVADHWGEYQQAPASLHAELKALGQSLFASQRDALYERARRYNMTLRMDQIDLNEMMWMEVRQFWSGELVGSHGFVIGFEPTKNFLD